MCQLPRDCAVLCMWRGFLRQRGTGLICHEHWGDDTWSDIWGVLFLTQYTYFWKEKQGNVSLYSLTSWSCVWSNLHMLGKDGYRFHVIFSVDFISLHKGLNAVFSSLPGIKLCPLWVSINLGPVLFPQCFLRGLFTVIQHLLPLVCQQYPAVHPPETWLRMCNLGLQRASFSLNQK